MFRSEKSRLTKTLNPDVAYDTWLNIRAKACRLSLIEVEQAIEVVRSQAQDIFEEVLSFEGPDPTGVLEKISLLRSTYPNLAKLKQEQPQFSSPPFALKVDALNTWMNASTLLNHLTDAIKNWMNLPHLSLEELVAESNVSRFVDTMLKDYGVRKTLELSFFTRTSKTLYKVLNSLSSYSRVFEAWNTGHQRQIELLAFFQTRFLTCLLDVQTKFISEALKKEKQYLSDILADMRFIVSFIFNFAKEYPMRSRIDFQ